MSLQEGLLSHYGLASCVSFVKSSDKFSCLCTLFCLRWWLQGLSSLTQNHFTRLCLVGDGSPIPPGITTWRCGPFSVPGRFPWTRFKHSCFLKSSGFLLQRLRHVLPSLPACLHPSGSVPLHPLIPVSSPFLKPCSPQSWHFPLYSAVPKSLVFFHISFLNPSCCFQLSLAHFCP